MSESDSTTPGEASKDKKSNIDKDNKIGPAASSEAEVAVRWETIRNLVPETDPATAPTSVSEAIKKKRKEQDWVERYISRKPTHYAKDLDADKEHKDLADENAEEEDDKKETETVDDVPALSKEEKAAAEMERARNAAEAENEETKRQFERIKQGHTWEGMLARKLESEQLPTMEKETKESLDPKQEVDVKKTGAEEIDATKAEADVTVFPSGQGASVSRPSDAELLVLFRQTPLAKSLGNPFRIAIDLLCRMVQLEYGRMTEAERRQTGMLSGSAPEFRSLCQNLRRELLATAAELGFPQCRNEPGSWGYLDRKEIVEVLGNKVYHGRIFRVLKERDLEPHHWSAIIFARLHWCLMTPDQEPMAMEGHGLNEKQMGQFEFVIKELLIRAPKQRQNRVEHVDNKMLVQHLSEAAESFQPRNKENAWWVEDK
ncbi:hypothetical protein BJ508DRAFT_331341 [Ascobolus immersus RN42]|uniref:Uncharacterized protein n=1 Tax=Ascobolus immersus RN42 TaxID=1160509 RepID=A0A3N4HWE2_ASCIM|nr:hypothetical protein BJ508DRAFT_331341 [Ascobolus immersus RN42]